jgi:NADPH:quinone reductase-like Zn-dependent oxidoreductase
MRAIRIHEFGGAEQLRLDEVEQPQPKADEVLTLDSPNNRAQYAKELMAHIKAGRLQVMVTEFPLAQAADTHRAIEGRTTMGKVVLAIN